MTVYSNSRLNRFEECPRAYKFKYIERVEVERRRNIYGFLGSVVHETLERFHDDMERNEKRSLKGVVKLFFELWSENWCEDIEIPHTDRTPEHFKEKGVKCVERYYEKHAPFEGERTLGTELHVHPTIEADGREYSFQGLIDRLARDREGRYIIHDYKTSKYLPSRSDLMKDRQLPLYQIGVQQRYANSEGVEVVWHYLRHGKSFRVEFGEEDLDAVRSDIVDLIGRIEEARDRDDFPTMRDDGAYCDYCDYQELCPEWRHIYGVEDSGSGPTQNSLEHYL